MPTMLVPMLLGVAVVGLIGALGLVLSRSPGSVAERRLAGLGGQRAREKRDLQASLMLRPETSASVGPLKLLAKLSDFEWLVRLYDQADVRIALPRFLAVAATLVVLGIIVPIALKLSIIMVPVAAAGLGSIPFLWLLHRKSARVRKITTAMPEAMDLMARALRAGHGLASGINLISEELTGPIATEFGRVFEEQNFGIPLDVSLRSLAERVPSMDVRFFVTAVVVQRGTGGDLAEILEKIGKLIRQRFELAGHVKSLTAEGRLSGIVLLALPPALLAFLQFSNPEYVGILFSTRIGNKLLAITAFVQLLGAVSIKKIVAIKV